MRIRRHSSVLWRQYELPKGSSEEKAARQQAMKEATEYAIEALRGDEDCI